MSEKKMVSVLLVLCTKPKIYQPQLVKTNAMNRVVIDLHHKGYFCKTFAAPPHGKLSPKEKNDREMHLFELRHGSFKEVWFFGGHLPDSDLVDDIVATGRSVATMWSYAQRFSALWFHLYEHEHVRQTTKEGPLVTVVKKLGRNDPDLWS